MFICHNARPINEVIKSVLGLSSAIFEPKGFMKLMDLLQLLFANACYLLPGTGHRMGGRETVFFANKKKRRIRLLIGPLSGSIRCVRVVIIQILSNEIKDLGKGFILDSG